MYAASIKEDIDDKTLNGVETSRKVIKLPRENAYKGQDELSTSRTRKTLDDERQNRFHVFIITSLNSLSVQKLLDLSHPYFAYICLPLLLPYWALLQGHTTGPCWPFFIC